MYRVVLEARITNPKGEEHSDTLVIEGETEEKTVEKALNKFYTDGQDFVEGTLSEIDYKPVAKAIGAKKAPTKKKQAAEKK